MEIHQLLFPHIVTINKVAEDMNTLTLLLIAFDLKLMKHDLSKKKSKKHLTIEQDLQARFISDT